MSSNHSNGTSTAATLAKSPHAAAAAAKAGVDPSKKAPVERKKKANGAKESTMLSMTEAEIEKFIRASFEKDPETTRNGSLRKLRESGKSCGTTRYYPAFERIAKERKHAPAPKAPEKKAAPKAEPEIKPIPKPTSKKRTKKS